MSYSAVTAVPFNNNYIPNSYNYNQKFPATLTTVNPSYNYKVHMNNQTLSSAYNNYNYYNNLVNSYDINPNHHESPRNGYEYDYDYQINSDYPNVNYRENPNPNYNYYENPNGNIDYQKQNHHHNFYVDHNDNDNTIPKKKVKSFSQKIQKMRRTIYDRFMTHLRNRDSKKLKNRSMGLIGGSIMSTLLFPPALIAFMFIMMDIMRNLIPFRPSLIPALYELMTSPPKKSTKTETTAKPIEDFTKIEFNPPKMPGVTDILREVNYQLKALQELKSKNKKKKKKNEEEDDSEEANDAFRRRFKIKPKRWQVNKRRRHKLTLGMSTSQLQKFYKVYRPKKSKQRREIAQF